MAVIPLDQSKRKTRRPPKTPGQVGKVLSFSELSPSVMLKHLERQAAKELAYLQDILLLTHGEPEILPSLEQMQEIVDGTIEF